MILNKNLDRKTKKKPGLRKADVFKIGYKKDDLCTATPILKMRLIFSTIVLTPSSFELILNPIGTLNIESKHFPFYANVLFVLLSKQCPLSNLLNYFIIIGNFFPCGTAEAIITQNSRISIKN